MDHREFTELKKYWDSYLRKHDFIDPALFNFFEESHYNLLSKLYKLSSRIKGDIVECGVGYGKSLLILSSLLSVSKINKKIFAFDSFEGFPEPSDFDKNVRNPLKGEWGGTSTNLIMTLLRESKLVNNILVKERVELVKGFFDATLPKYKEKISSIALLHLDGDLYNSYKIPLNNIWEMVPIGGIIIFDEYRHPKWPGATLAVDEFFNGKDQIIQRDTSSQRHFLIKK